MFAVAPEEEQEERERGENSEHGALPEGVAAERGRLVAEEVDQEPGDHAGEGDWVPEQGEEDGDEDDDDVVHGEVEQVGAAPEVGVTEPARHGERGRVAELAPRPVRRQHRRPRAFAREMKLSEDAGGGTSEEVGIVLYFDMAGTRAVADGVLAVSGNFVQIITVSTTHPSSTSPWMTTPPPPRQAVIRKNLYF